MKKYIALLLVVTSSTLLAYESFIEAKFSYYYPTDNTTRDIYGGGWLYGVEGTIKGCWNLSPWASVSALPMKGRTVQENTKTKLTLVPIGIGLKYFWTLDQGNFYIGAGALPAYVRTRDFSSFVKKRRHKWGIGGIFKGGAMLFLNSWSFLDLFLEYQLLSFKFSDTNLSVGRKGDISGLSVGAGLGIRF